MFLVDFSVINPDPGLLIWTSVIFLTLWFFLGRIGFKPIAKALKEREESIHDALQQAELAREEMAAMQSKNEAILAEAREERSNILKEARQLKDNIVNEAKTKAKVEADKIVANARQEIINQKNAALVEVKNKAGALALEIAEKVIKRQLRNDSEQQNFVQKLVKDIKLN